MKRKNLWFAALSCLSGVLLMSGCSDNDMTTGSDSEVNGLHTYRVTANISWPEDTPLTRSLSEETGNVIRSEWEKNDQIIAYDLSDNDKSPLSGYSLLASMSTGKCGGFEGEFKTLKPIAPTDDLCFFYPGAASTGDDKSIVPTVRPSNEGFPLFYYEQQATIKRLVKLDVSRQDGTVATIGKKYDYQWAKANPMSVSGSDVKVKVGHMQRKIALWGMRFADKDGNILTGIDSVSISNVRALDVFDLGTGEFVAGNAADKVNTIVLTPAQGGKLSSADGKYTYAAMLPGTYTDVLVMAYVGNTCYATTYSSLTLEQDKVYRTNVLGMEVVVPNPYVEVKEVKWATGNFIHYSTPEYGEYWGIAPAQWWISNYAVEQGGNFIYSQFIDNYTQTPEDLDLFRTGDIARALNLKTDMAKTGTALHISKRFFANQQGSRETTQDNAKFGDIVWYYTNKDNQKYRMATDDEFRLLFSDAGVGVVPGFCYTDKGNRIYGAYFYTLKPGTERVKILFPTKAGLLYRYINVTPLVRASKGLFLPITGRRLNWSDEAGMRNMSAAAYGQYMTDYSPTSGLVRDFFFGTEWNLSGNASGQGKAIRPVWDESSNTIPNPVYEPFRNIR